MGNGAMTDRSGDWLAQAERDLEQARASQEDGRHEWACFAAQQSELIVYTRKEWKRLQRQGRKFARMLNSQVVWVYPDNL